MEGSLSAADRHLREGGWAAISQTIAREDHLHIGQRFTLPTPTGNASSPARRDRSRTTAGCPGAIVMNGDDHARLWGSTTATQLAVTLKPGIPIEQGKRAVEAALPAGSALTVKTADERRSEVSAVLGSTLSRLNDTTIVVLIATIASVIALMIAAIWQRRGRLDSLMSIGMSFGQFARLIFYESGLGAALGLPHRHGRRPRRPVPDRWLAAPDHRLPGPVLARVAARAAHRRDRRRHLDSWRR